MSACMTNDTIKQVLTIKEASGLLRVTEQTVRAWIRTGRLAAVRLTPRIIRIKQEAVEALLDSDCGPEADNDH